MQSEAPGVIFDCDGVLADTERFGHLPAFNQTFEELGLPVRWSEEEYGRRLAIGGGKERLASLLTDEFVAEAGLPTDKDAQLAEVARWHGLKTRIYTDMVAEGALPPRPGVRRVIEAGLAEGWEVAVASTSALPSVVAVLERVVGPDTAARIPVFAGDAVAHKKPAPDVYLLALERQDRQADNTIVVEDSRQGLLASTAADLPTVITVSSYTASEDFHEALLVVTSLGEPDGERTEVLERRCEALVPGYVTLDDLTAALFAGRRQVKPDQGGSR